MKQFTYNLSSIVKLMDKIDNFYSESFQADLIFDFNDGNFYITSWVTEYQITVLKNATFSKETKDYIRKEIDRFIQDFGIVSELSDILKSMKNLEEEIFGDVEG